MKSQVINKSFSTKNQTLVTALIYLTFAFSGCVHSFQAQELFPEPMPVSNGKDVLSSCLAKSGTTNQNKPEKTGLLKNGVDNKSAVFEQKQAIFNRVPVAQLDRALASGARGCAFESHRG